MLVVPSQYHLVLSQCHPTLCMGHPHDRDQPGLHGEDGDALPTMPTPKWGSNWGTFEVKPLGNMPMGPSGDRDPPSRAVGQLSAELFGGAQPLYSWGDSEMLPAAELPTPGDATPRC